MRENETSTKNRERDREGTADMKLKTGESLGKGTSAMS